MTFYIFSIDGNIGSGKSTLLKLLSEKLKKIYGLPVIYLQEPVNDWIQLKDENNSNLIENYYKNQEKWAFSFQITTLISRIALLKKINNNDNCIVLTERSIDTDKNVFCKMLYDDTLINHLNYNIYLKWYNEFIKDYPITGYIYIKTSPDKAFERVLKRKRKEEDGVPLDYLKKCNTYHEEWLNTKKIILTLNANKDIDTDILPDEWEEEIISFISDNVPKNEYEVLFKNYFMDFHPFC
jgi:deoxyguanosine kinase